MSNTIIKVPLLQKETIRLLDRKMVIFPYANTKYTGELKKQWDTVTVETFPNVAFTTWTTAWDPIAGQDITITSENLSVDQAASLRITLKDIEKVQSNLDLEAKIADRIAYAQANLLDDYITSTILNSTNANITKLNDGAAVALDKTNIFEEIEKMVVALKDNNAGENSVLFVAPAVASLLRQSGILDASDAWLAVREKWYLGLISGVIVKEAVNLSSVNKMIMMDRDSVHFVAQLTKVDTRLGTDGFYENIIAELVYGSTIFDENGKRICTNEYSL